MSKEQWKADYETAYLAANRKSVQVVNCGSGWYRIVSCPESSLQRYRRSEIEVMTARLRTRLGDEGKSEH